MRGQELREYRKYLLVSTALYTIQNVMPLLVAVLSFGAYVGLGNVLSASTAFTSLSLFDILRSPLWKLPR